LSSRCKESYSIQSVENALDLLEALCDEADEFRISHLSEKLRMNKTSVFRLLATFENRGYVERETVSGKYRLGLSAYEIGQKFLSRMGLLRNARPVMERLVRDCNEAVYLVMRRADDILFLDMVDTSQQVKVISLVGKHYPLTTTAAGKMMLAHSPSRALHHCAPDWPDAGELGQIGRQGFCVDHGGLGDGIVSAAVPLLNAAREICGCLCLVGPDFRMPPDKLEMIVLPALREAGEIVSSKLGHLEHYLRSGN
jgi:DNA-binding IclR family transcriptional regulator